MDGVNLGSLTLNDIPNPTLERSEFARKMEDYFEGRAKKATVLALIQSVCEVSLQHQHTHGEYQSKRYLFDQYTKITSAFESGQLKLRDLSLDSDGED